MRPEENDYAPYYKQYIDTVEGEDILLILDKQIYTCLETLKNISPEKENYAYAADKWTVKQLVAHIVDTERIMAYRSLRISRNDKTPIPGFDQDSYAAVEYTDNRSYQDIVTEWEHLRKSNLLLFKGYTEEMMSRRGTASNKEITALSLLYIIAGHLNHHLKILTERYLA